MPEARRDRQWKPWGDAVAAMIGNLERTAETGPDEVVHSYDAEISLLAEASSQGERNRLAEALYYKGFELWALGRPQEAVSVFDDLVARVSVMRLSLNYGNTSRAHSLKRERRTTALAIARRQCRRGMTCAPGSGTIQPSSTVPSG